MLSSAALPPERKPFTCGGCHQVSGYESFVDDTRIYVGGITYLGVCRDCQNELVQKSQRKGRHD